MKYLLMIYENEAGWLASSEAERNAIYAEYGAFTEKVAAAGVLLGGSELHPTSTATTVRVRGETLITDGPFAETKEQLGGYYLLECKDLDEALHWAAQIPTAKHGSIEVRPLKDNP